MPLKFSDSEWRDVMNLLANNPKMSSEYAKKLSGASDIMFKKLFYDSVINDDQATSFSGESFATATKVLAETTDREIMSGKPIGTAHVNGKPVPIYEKMQ